MPDAPAVYDAARMPPRRQAFHAERAVGPRHVEYHRQQQRREHPGGEEEEILRREA